MAGLTVGEARLQVIARDGGCIAQILDPVGAGPCYDKWGLPLGKYPPMTSLEVDRIRDEPSMGKAPSHTDPSRMVSVCPGHHRGTGPQGGRQWATSHREEIRAYLEKVRNRPARGFPA